MSTATAKSVSTRVVPLNDWVQDRYNRDHEDECRRVMGDHCDSPSHYGKLSDNIPLPEQPVYIDPEDIFSRPYYSAHGLFQKVEGDWVLVGWWVSSTAEDMPYVADADLEVTADVIAAVNGDPADMSDDDRASLDEATEYLRHVNVYYW